jgi:hypothetical protein
MEDLTMKKTLVLISVILFCLAGSAKDPFASWILTGEGKMDCKKINIGNNNARIVLVNGVKKTVPIELISSYTLNGKVFTRLPLYKNGKPTGQMVFMELIKTVGELSLYELEEPDFGTTLRNAKIFSYFPYIIWKLHLLYFTLYLKVLYYGK